MCNGLRLPCCPWSLCLIVRYFKQVDMFNNKLISTFITPSSIPSHCVINKDIKLILLHETRNDEGIRAFFNDVWESYIKTLLNPFYIVNKPIKSPLFEAKIRALAKVPLSLHRSQNSNCRNTYRISRIV